MLSFTLTDTEEHDSNRHQLLDLVLVASTVEVAGSKEPVFGRPGWTQNRDFNSSPVTISQWHGSRGSTVRTGVFVETWWLI